MKKGLFREDGSLGFNTPTKKVELYSTILENYGYDSLPIYKEPVLSPYNAPEQPKEYPFIVMTGPRTFPFYDGLGLQIQILRKLEPDPSVEISPASAEKLGL